jgi:hypothetical protein
LHTSTNKLINSIFLINEYQFFFCSLLINSADSVASPVDINVSVQNTIVDVNIEDPFSISAKHLSQQEADECLRNFSEKSDFFMSDDSQSRIPGEDIMAIISAICGQSHNPVSQADVNKVHQAMARVRRTSGSSERNAERHAEGSVYPPEFFTRDVGQLERMGNLENLITDRHQKMSANRFNLDRFNELYHDDEEKDRLYSLATSGAKIDTAPDFIPIAEPEPMRSLLRKVPNTIRSHVSKLWESGNVLVLPLKAILADNPHTSSLHIVFQDSVAKPLGRLLGDLTNRSVGNALNNPEAKPAIIARYGELHYCTIIDLIRASITVARAVGGFKNVRMYKEDVVGAFGQFNFNAGDCRLLVFAFTLDFVLVYMTGLFGWMGAPFVFGVFTRAILRLIRSRIHESSLADMFCDDVIGFSGVQHAISDQAITVLIIEGTFGKGSACKRKKYGPSICGEAIGWYLDFFMETVRPNDKGIDSLTRCFLSLRHDTAISHKEYQVIASLACRYSLGLKGMRPFVHPLFRMITKSKRKPRVPSTEAWTAILMWQAIIIALIISPTNLSVSLYSFALFSEMTNVSLISDAGPKALGLAIYLNDVCIGYVSYVLPWDASDPRYQNCREFMGHLLGKILILKLKLGKSHVTHVTSFSWVGDNMSALAWVAKQSCRSINTQLAFLADCWLSTMHDINTVKVDHLAGKLMGDHDGLSRLRDHSFDPKLNLDHLIDHAVMDLFVLCNPTVEDIGNKFSVATFKRLLLILQDI